MVPMQEAAAAATVIQAAYRGHLARKRVTKLKVSKALLQAANYFFLWLQNESCIRFEGMYVPSRNRHSRL